MRYLILILITTLLAACAQDQGSSPSDVTDVPTDGSEQQSVCKGNLQRAWVNNSNRLRYELYSNCSGKIPSCELEFEWDYIEQTTNYKGLININVTKVGAPMTGCPEVGKTACEYAISSRGATILSMSLECDGYFPATFNPLYSLE